MNGAAPPGSALEELNSFGNGKTSKRDDPGPVKFTLTAEQRKERHEEKRANAVRGAKLEAAAMTAARDLSAAHVGVVRASLFDADEWKKEHAARTGRMESTFGRLYRPQANTYWTQKQKPPPRTQPSSQLPAYTSALPAALSLAHPSSREQQSDESDNETEVASPTMHPAADFDPMAEPQRFYAEFKRRINTLRGDVRAPNDDRGPTSAPRAADAVVAAATAPSPPKQPELPLAANPQSQAPSWVVGALSAPILDEDFDVEPSLVYTDSAHYLADHGVQIPMWDEVRAA